MFSEKGWPYNSFPNAVPMETTDLTTKADERSRITTVDDSFQEFDSKGMYFGAN